MSCQNSIMPWQIKLTRGSEPGGTEAGGWNRVLGPHAAVPAAAAVPRVFSKERRAIFSFILVCSPREQPAEFRSACIHVQLANAQTKPHTEWFSANSLVQLRNRSNAAQKYGCANSGWLRS